MPITTEQMRAILSTIVKTSFPAANIVDSPVQNTSMIRHLPIATLRMGVKTPFNAIMNRMTPDVGDYEIQNFTIQCLASNCNIDGCSKNKYANDMADVITKYMKKNRSAFKINEIHDIYEVNSHELTVEDFSSYTTSRSLISGELLVRNTD